MKGKLDQGHERTERPHWGNFPGGPVVEDPSASSGATGLIPVLGRFHMQHSN